MRHLFNACRVKQHLWVFGSLQFLLVLLAFDALKLWPHGVIVHLKLQHLLVSNGIGNNIAVQFVSENVFRCFCSCSIFAEDRRACKAELIKALELSLQVFLCFAKLRAMAFVEDKHHLLTINLQVGFAFHQVVQLLNGGNDNSIIFFQDVSFQFCRAYRPVYAVGRKLIILFHRLVIKVFTVYHKKHLIYKVELRGKASSLKASKRLTAPRCVPHIPPAFGLAPLLGLVRTFNLPYQPFGSGNLIRAHNQQRIGNVEHRVSKQHLHQGVFL